MADRSDATTTTPIGVAARALARARVVATGAGAGSNHDSGVAPAATLPAGRAHMDVGSGAGEKLAVSTGRGAAAPAGVDGSAGCTAAGGAVASAGVVVSVSASAFAGAVAPAGAGGCGAGAGGCGAVAFRSDGHPTSRGWVSSSGRSADGWSLSLMGGVVPRSDAWFDASLRAPCSVSRARPLAISLTSRDSGGEAGSVKNPPSLRDVQA